VEPTESEGLDELDRFVDAMTQIADEARTNPDLLKKAPVKARRSRFDEATAARKPVLRWKPGI
jgi:glycine dehydrogenase subunit 2